MATSTLFGYSVEDQEGKLVITIEGSYAEEILRYLREGLKSGKGTFLISQLLPLNSLRRLMSASVNIAAPENDNSDSDEERPLTIEEIFNQRMDQNYESFEQQLARMRESLKPEGSQPVNAKAEVGNSAQQARKARKKAKR